jgi:hypothetical protein
LVKKLTRSSDKRFAAQVFLLAGTLSDKHQVSIGVADAEHKVRTCIPQLAPPALHTFGF